MRNKLLISTALTALLVGTSLAAAQDTKKEGGSQVPQAQQQAPAEKMAPSAKPSTSGSGSAGSETKPDQKAQEKGAPSPTQKPGDTTGQAGEKSPSAAPSQPHGKETTEPKKGGGIHPQWHGYLYFLVGDQIVVVEPSSYRIVAVLTV